MKQKIRKREWNMWNFYQPVNVIWGEGETKNLASHLAKYGFEKAFLIADAFLVSSGAAARLQEAAAGRIIAVSSDVEPNPTLENVDVNARLAKKAGADCIIVFGGGSVMDCGKAAAAAIAMDITAEQLLGNGPVKQALPVIAVPTTAGTGSEVTAGAVLSDKKRGVKTAVFGPALFATAAIVDPELTYSVPAKVTAATGLDVLAHAIDAMSSVKANPATDAEAEKACELAVRYLERAVRDGMDKEARAGMSQASTIAGLAFSQTGTAGSHACSYILTSKYHVPHGEACAFTLDCWLRINAKARPELDVISRRLGFDNAEAFADWLNEIKKKSGMRTTLAEIGASEKDIPELVKAAMASSNMANNIARIGEEGVATIFRSRL